MNKHKSNKIKENSNTVRHLIMGQIITTQNLVATKVVRLAGQQRRAPLRTDSLGRFSWGPVPWSADPSGKHCFNRSGRVSGLGKTSWYARGTKSRVKIFGKSHHEWPKIVIHSNECIILVLTCYSMFWTHHSPKNNHRLLILSLSPRTVFSDFALWSHYSW